MLAILEFVIKYGVEGFGKYKNRGGKMKKFLLTLAVFLVALSLCDAEQIKDGFGKAQLPDSSVYDGNFKNGLFNGKGTLTRRDGARYEGEFKDGLFDGKGIVNHSNGVKYEGEFKDGLANGKGI